MSKSIKTMMCVAGSLLLVSALAMAQTAAKNSDKDKTKQPVPPPQQQHSRLSKAAFWRRNSNASKNGKNAQVKPASSNQSKPKTAQVKPVAAKQVAANKNPKPAQPASAGKPATKKAPVASKTKSQPIQDSNAAPLKQ